MKKLIVLIALTVISVSLNAQKYIYTEASELNLIGKIHKQTPNPYHRVDTVKYKGFTHGENIQETTATLFGLNPSRNRCLRS